MYCETEDSSLSVGDVDVCIRKTLDSIFVMLPAIQTPVREEEIMVTPREVAKRCYMGQV
jgi:hypothetical protein